MDLTGWLRVCPIVAILRGIEPKEVESICSALESEGIAIVEVPLNSPNALESIAILSRTFGDRMLIGAGTVTKAGQVADVAARGGHLIVTPNAHTAIVRTSKETGLLVIPGCFTPTEAFELLDAGADAIKLFPAEVLGTPMLKALRAVLPKSAGMIPVGGINAENIPEWMAAGAVGVGVGTSIYRPGDDVAVVQHKARALVTAVAQHTQVGVKT
jgi:2-dehydro-3-deoxyphosphogalactonate aldolase